MLNNPDDYLDFCENQDISVECIKSQLKYILNNISMDSNSCNKQHEEILDELKSRCIHV